MHQLLLDAVVANCRKRIDEGDCVVTPPQHRATLELAIVQLADDLAAALRARAGAA